MRRPRTRLHRGNLFFKKKPKVCGERLADQQGRAYRVETPRGNCQLREVSRQTVVTSKREALFKGTATKVPKCAQSSEHRGCSAHEPKS
jgi:hypothetical protein